MGRGGRRRAVAAREGTCGFSHMWDASKVGTVRARAVLLSSNGFGLNADLRTCFFGAG